MTEGLPGSGAVLAAVVLAVGDPPHPIIGIESVPKRQKMSQVVQGFFIHPPRQKRLAKQLPRGNKAARSFLGSLLAGYNFMVGRIPRYGQSNPTYGGLHPFKLLELMS